MSIKQELEAFASECRAAREKGTPLPAWQGDGLCGADLSGMDLADANLQGVNMEKADLFGANLSRVCLRDATLRGADLRDADLSNADLSNADLSDAYLGGAVWYITVSGKIRMDEMPPCAIARHFKAIEGGCWCSECMYYDS